MPNVNTLIVNQADKLGLYQLYQLRGRVGRGTNRAYAYFLYRRGKELTDTAQARLKTIFQTTMLGAGFQIAMKDLEIRGAGNILGPEQSGHIAAVGFDMYSRMLAEAVSKLKREMTKEEEPIKYIYPAVDLPLASHIPEYYVDDLDLRLSLYQHLAKITSLDEIEEMTKDFKDRFGALPDAVLDLLYTLRIKITAAQAGAKVITRDDNHIIIDMGEGRRPDQTLMPVGVKSGARFIRLDITQKKTTWKTTLLKILQRMAKKD
jgi:transcription-repair coupling factor (superfamily II helicase)